MFKQFTEQLHITKQPYIILLTIGFSVLIPYFAIVPLVQMFLFIKDLETYLNKDIFKVNGTIEELKVKQESLQTSVVDLQKLYNISSDIDVLIKEKNRLDKKVNHLRAVYNIDENLADLEDEQAKLTFKILELNKQYIEEDEKILYQSFGIYKPYYDFEHSDLYKARLKVVTDKQKALVKDDSAFHYSSEYSMNGSTKTGKKMQQSFAKFGMTTFNLECTTAIKGVKFNNFEQMETKIERSYTKVNKGLENFSIAIRKNYLDLKLDELHLAYEYAKIKQKEREEEQEARRLQREEEAELKRIQKEVDAERKKLDKERSHFETALKDKREQLESIESEEDKKVIEEELLKLEEKIEQVLEQDEHLDEKLIVKNKAGYVYIISNIGAFGEDVYKIGVTRRALPEDRVKELSGAAVPFKFDIHALIFSDDAFALENALHKEFADKQVNLANNKKEFFHVTLDEIKDVVRQNYNKVAEFVDIPEAEEYRQSILMLEEVEKVS